MGKKKNNIVMFACSEGGHFAQMMALKELFGKYNSVLVTDNYRATKEMPALNEVKDIYYIGGISDYRKKNANSDHNDSRMKYLGGYWIMFKHCYRALKQFRPKVIVSTGSNVAVPLFWFGKILGCKLIFIETRAHVYSKSLSGKLVGGISDVVIVQWPEMLRVYKNALYYGTLV